MMLVTHKKTQKIICKNIIEAKTFWQRSKGLLGRDSLTEEGLLIHSSNSIHTFFMQFSIDVVFLNSQNKIVKIFRNLLPWRMTSIYFSATKVLELPANTLDLQIEIGDELEFSHV